MYEHDGIIIYVIFNEKIQIIIYVATYVCLCNYMYSIVYVV